MPKYVAEKLPEQLQELLQGAKAGKISPISFCKALDEHGITGSEKILYIAEAFGLPLQQAKTIWIKGDYGSVDDWAEQIGEVIEELSEELEKDTRKLP